jgi:hypothetical protein
MLSTHPDNASWRSADDLRTLRWYKTTVTVPANLLTGSAVFRLDATGLGKGFIWINGRGVGRHWLIDAKMPPDTPSQRYYHIPAGWLTSSNDLVILEEFAKSPANVQLQARS